MLRVRPPALGVPRMKIDSYVAEEERPRRPVKHGTFAVLGSTMYMFRNVVYAGNRSTVRVLFIGTAGRHWHRRPRRHGSRLHWCLAMVPWSKRMPGQAYRVAGVGPPTVLPPPVVRPSGHERRGRLPKYAVLANAPCNHAQQCRRSKRHSNGAGTPTARAVKVGVRWKVDGRACHARVRHRRRNAGGEGCATAPSERQAGRGRGSWREVREAARVQRHQRAALWVRVHIETITADTTRPANPSIYAEWSKCRQARNVCSNRNGVGQV